MFLSLRNCTVALAFLFFSCCIVIIGLVGANLAWMNEVHDKTFPYHGQLSSDLFYWLPEYNQKRSYYVMISAASIGAAVTLGILYVVCRGRNYSVVVTGRKPARLVQPHFLIIVGSGLALALFIASVALAFHDRHLNDILSLGGCLFTRNASSYSCSFTKSQFTIEDWACNRIWPFYSRYIPSYVVPKIHNVCIQTKVARWFTLPSLVLSVLLLISGLLLLRQSNMRKFLPRHESDASTLVKGEDDSGKYSIVSSVPASNLSSTNNNRTAQEGRPIEGKAEILSSPVSEAGGTMRHEVLGDRFAEQMPSGRHETSAELPAYSRNNSNEKKSVKKAP